MPCGYGAMMFNRFPVWLVKLIFWIAERWPWLSRFINRIIINATVNATRHRPHPWSTVHDYVSWTSLTDQRWSARHLQAAAWRERPAPNDLAVLFERQDGKQRLCPKSTCLFPAFAQYLTDGFIRTRMPDPSKKEDENLRLQNTSNHQIDLCPLYGRTTEQTAQLRADPLVLGKKGRLKSQFLNGQEYAPFLFDKDGLKQEFNKLDLPLGIEHVQDHDKPLLFAFGGDRANASPMVSAMNTLFLREHNRLAGVLEQKNPHWDDTRVFETARVITIVCFIKIVVEDYINHIMPVPFRLKADPSVTWKAPWNKPNWITTEFSLLYRWHSLIPDTLKLSSGEIPAGAFRFRNDLLIGGGLTAFFTDLSRQPAGAIGPHNTTQSLQPIEVSAIMQDERCQLETYAAYREYVGLSKPKQFSDITSNAALAQQLAGLYKSPQDVDFYVGLFAEDTVPNSPLPALILKMVAVDAFSQALTNPLLSQHVFNAGTFTDFGMETILATSTLTDLIKRNDGPAPEQFIGFTRQDWQHSWH
jgi:prostaglandin-endoperoxide synthase 2